MEKLLSTISLFLMSSWALAAKMEDASNAPPVEGVSMVYVVIFLVAFIGLIIGFFLYMVYLDKKKKKADQ